MLFRSLRSVCFLVGSKTVWENCGFLGVFAIGECLSIYFYKSKRKAAGILFASSSLLLGVVAFAGLYYNFSLAVMETTWISWLLIMVVAMYSAFKTARAFAFLFFPAFTVAQIVSPSLSILAFLSLLALLLGLLLAGNLSEIDLGPFNSGTATLRVLVAPFRQLEILAVDKIGKRSRPVLFVLYSIFIALVVVIPIVVGELFQEIAQPELLLLIPLAYFSCLAVMWRANGISPGTSSS